METILINSATVIAAFLSMEGVAWFTHKFIMRKTGDKIRYCRNLKAWSQADMADRLDITVGALSRIERGETDLNYSRLEQIAKAFGITVIDLLSVSEKPKPRNEWEKLLLEKDKEIMKLQKRIIDLLDSKK